MTVSAGTTSGRGGGVGSFAGAGAGALDAAGAGASGEEEGEDDDCWSADFWQPKSARASAKQTKERFADRGDDDSCTTSVFEAGEHSHSNLTIRGWGLKSI